MNGLYYGIRLRDYITGLYYGVIILLDYITESYYGIILRNHMTGLYYGNTVRNYMIGSYYGIMLWSNVTEIILMDPGEPQGVPGGSWDLWRRPGHAPGTSGDAPRTPWGPSQTIKTAISQRKKLSIAASASCHCNASPQRAQAPPRQP